MADRSVNTDAHAQANCFIIEKDGRLHLAVTVAEYAAGETEASSSDELRRMFDQGRRGAALEAVEVAAPFIAAVKPSKPKPARPPRKPTKPRPGYPGKPPRPPQPGPPPPPPPPGPPGVGTDPPGVGTEGPGIGTESPGIGTEGPGIGTNQ